MDILLARDPEVLNVTSVFIQVFIVKIHEYGHEAVISLRYQSLIMEGGGALGKRYT